jgi:hypothetical protein
MSTAIKQVVLANAILFRAALEDGTLPEESLDCGLCTNLRFGRDYGGETALYSEARRVLLDIFVQWPESSGEKEYPVIGGELMYWSNEHKYEGEYGAARLRLLQFIIDTLTKELT